MEGLTEGRIVHFVIPDGNKNAGEHRPAIIVKVWNKASGYVNLWVFFDGTNDGEIANTPWQTSIPYSEQPDSRTWHWIEKA